ncbi:MAG: PEP-CTERM protein-sorting domain-containing protein [Candidatus Nitrotoga sp. CP45]|nr:MAG: PEP-CTERM protein-sorting domain-containing protein [Candidatus Nitrotoga sp. CP45]
MNNIKSHFVALIAFIGMGFFSCVAQSALVTTSFTGAVTTDNSGSNPFGLVNGNSITGSAIYDDALVLGTSTDETIFINGLSSWDFKFTLGSFSFSQSDVTDPTYTRFFFNNGKLDGVRFYLEPIDIGSFKNLQIEDFGGAQKLFVEEATLGSPVYLEASWNFANASTPVPVKVGSVPEPGVMWLFATGLIGFIGMKKPSTANKNSLTGKLPPVCSI